jgi:hypothetical protein
MSYASSGSNRRRRRSVYVNTACSESNSGEFKE